jgi:hypothetical protein
MLRKAAALIAAAGFVALAQPGTALTIGELAAERGNRTVEIVSLPVHPWFGSGPREWDRLLSELLDRIVVVEGEPGFVDKIGLSHLFLSYLDNRIAQGDEDDIESSPDREDALKRAEEIERELAEIQVKLGEPDAEKVQLRRRQEKLQQELLSLRMTIGERRPARSSLYALLREKSKEYQLAGGLLRHETQPLLGEYGVISEWNSVGLSSTSGCLDYRPQADVETYKFENLDINAEVVRLAVHRKWAGTVFGTERAFFFEDLTEEQEDVRGLVGKRLYKVDAIYLARSIELRGALSLPDIEVLNTEQPGGVEASAGCTTIMFSSGLGFTGQSAYPLSLPSGLLVHFPQIVAIELGVLPTVETGD